MDDSEQELIGAALRGDEASFEMIIRSESRRLYAIAFAILQDAAEAEDVVQETFVKAWGSRWRLRSAEKFPGWLATVARNRARDFLRRRRVERVRPLDGHEPAMAPEPDAGPMEDAELKQRMHALLAGLPESHRVALTLRYLQGMDHRAIQREMGLSDGALRGILGRALGTMRKGLKPTLAALE